MIPLKLTSEMKVTNSVEKITPFGGFNFVIKVFGLADLVNKHLGSREKTFGFSYSDIFANPLAEYLNGGNWQRIPYICRIEILV